MKVAANQLIVQKDTMSVSNLVSENLRNHLNQFNCLRIEKIYKGSLPSDTTGYDVHGNLVRINELSGWLELTFPLEASIQTIIDSLTLLPEVLGAHRDRYINSDETFPSEIPTSNPDAQRKQWGLYNPDGRHDMNAPVAWDFQKGRADVIVAVLDDGIEHTHHDLDPGDRTRVIEGRNFYNDADDDLTLPESGSRHGTSVAGVIGAITNNGEINGVNSIAGVMWYGKMMPIKIMKTEPTTNGRAKWVARGIDWANQHGAKIFSMSFEVQFDDDVKEAIGNAYLQGKILCAASGKSGTADVNFPAGFFGVIAVGASGKIDQWLSFSNYGSHISVVAPGDYYRTTDINDSYREDFRGTSLATPLVAGAAGLIVSQGLDRNLDLTNDDVKHLLEATADDKGDHGKDDYFGYGRINVGTALQKISPPYDLQHAVLTNGNVTLMNDSYSQVVIPQYYGDQLNVDTYASCRRYKASWHVNFATPFLDTPLVWIRERQTTGWEPSNPNRGIPWAQVSNVSTTGFDVETYVYWIGASLANQVNKYWPGNYSNLVASVAYTVIGRHEISTPSNLLASVQSTTAIRLTWQDNSTNEASFKIERSTDGVNYITLGELVTSGNGAGVRTFDDGSPQQNTTYYYRVVATAQEFVSAYSNVTSEIIPIFSAPAGLVAESQPLYVKLTWSSVPNANGYKIYRNGSLLGSTNDLTYWAPSSDYSQGYLYEVRAYRDAIDGPTATASGQSFHLKASSSSATLLSGQRKIVQQSTTTHMVFQSGGSIWYIQNPGSGWSNEFPISLSLTAKNPSISTTYSGGHINVHIVWEEDLAGPWGTHRYILYRRSTDNGVSWQDAFGIDGEYYYPVSGDATPAIASDQGQSEQVLVVWRWGWDGVNGGLVMLPNPAEGGQHFHNVTGTNLTSKSPALQFGQGGFKLAFEQDAGKINFVEFGLGEAPNYSPDFGNVTDLSSAYAWMTGCKNPSVSSLWDGSVNRVYVAWEGLNNGASRVFLREGTSAYPAPSWQAVGEFSHGSHALRNPSVGVDVTTGKVSVIWECDTHIARKTRLVSSSTWSSLADLGQGYAPSISATANAGLTPWIAWTSNTQAPYSVELYSYAVPVPPVLYQPANGVEGVGTSITLGWYSSMDAESYQVQVSTSDAPFSDGIFKDQSGITATSYQPGGLSYSSTYYWRVRATNGMGTGNWSAVWSFDTQAESPPGCPYVFSWNGDSFVIDNNILPQSDYVGNEQRDVTDTYRLLAAPSLINGSYTIELREFEREHSAIDQVELLAVDHSQGTDVAIAPSGEIVEYVSAYILCSAPGTDLDGQLGRLSNMEGQALAVNPGESFLLNFAPVLSDSSLNSFGSNRYGLLLGGWVERDGKAPSNIGPGDKKPLVGLVGGSYGMVMGKPVSFTFRERATLAYVPIDELFNPQLSVYFTEKVGFDFANLVIQTKKPTYIVKELPLLEARHSIEGVSTAVLMNQDGQKQEMFPGESIRLSFQSLPIQAGKTRSFVLVSTGRYQHLHEGESTTRKPKEFALEQNYPNPFNPTTKIRYGLTNEVRVSLKIYNTFGQEIAHLVDEMQSAGFHEVTFDGGGLSSGIYFYKLQAGTYSAVKKLMLLK